MECKIDGNVNGCPLLGAGGGGSDDNLPLTISEPCHAAWKLSKLVFKKPLKWAQQLVQKFIT